ncbi:MAG: hypothetical protein ABIN74_07415, partial [Ferruginibacter sp.]
MKFQWRTSLVFGYVFILGIFCSTSVYAQNPVLSQRLQGKVRLKDIMQEVDDYYRGILGSSLAAPDGSKKKQTVKEYKRWKRWEWYHSARLNPDGSIANASEKILEALNVSGNNSFGGDNPGDPSSLTNSGAWTNMGPSSTVAGPLTYARGIGRCDRITFHPTDPLIYYVSTPAGGLWRTTNDGATWTNLSDELPTMGISGMVVSHANPNTLYILTGDGDSNVGGFVEGFGYLRWSQGVFRSTDGGSTWQKMGAFPSMPAFYSGFKLVQSPDDANTLLAATSSGLFRTSDAGLTWENVSPNGFETAVFHDVEFSPPGAFRTAYAVAKLPQGAYFCTSGGSLQFTRVSTTGLPGNNGIFTNNDVVRYAIGVSNADPELVVLLAGPSIDSTGFQGIFVSTSGGSIFTPKANTPNILGGAVNGLSVGDQAVYDHCVAVAPNDVNKIVTGGLCVWRSDNGGTSLAAISKYFEGTVGAMGYIHPDVHDVSYNPLKNYLYACTDGGVYKSIDHGNTWTNISSGLIVTQYYHLAGITSDVNKLLGGAQDNGTTYRKTNSSQYTHIRGADGHRTSINSTNSNIIYWTENETIYRSNDAAVANLNNIMPVATNAFYPAFRLNPSNQSKVYIGTGHKHTGNQK